MNAAPSLSEEIQRLRRKFHLKLSQKRGLLIDERDLTDVATSKTDESIQGYCERLSLWRRMFSFARKGE
jgi:hypothetical protein